MALEVVNAIVSKVSGLLVEPIGHQIGYMWTYSSNVQNLKDAVEKLKGQRQSVKHCVDEAKTRGEEIEEMVDKWFGSVDETTLEAEDILQDNDTASITCFTGLCPNLETRYQLSRKAKKMKEVVVEIQKGGNFDRVSHYTSPQWTGPSKDYEAFESRMLVLKRIVGTLKDDEVNMIGVYGMGGLGKTTLVKEVASLLKEEGIFRKKKVGDVKHPNLAIEVAKRCTGLPILIVAVATALKNKQLFEWKNALDQLKRFDESEIDEKVASALKLSFNSLKEGIHNGQVRMHDVVPNFAISVASTDHHVFNLAFDTVLEWPSKDKLEQCTAIYLRQYYCVLEELSAIGELSKLQILSLLDSTIVQLPRDIGKLTCLRLLDLSNCSSLEVIPPDVLSRLTRLEDLYMGCSFVQWEGEEHDAPRENANLAELKLLTNLVSLDIHIIDAKILPRDLFFEKLERFNIVIGDIWDWSWKEETSRTLKLKLNTRIQLKSIKLLLTRTENLYLDDLKGVKNVICELNGLGFPELKHLHIRNSLDIHYIIDSIRLGPQVVFPRLESLILDHLINLEKICCDELEANSFSSLRKLNVKHCDSLKNLFSFSMAGGLARLEELNVSNCKLMEAIFAKEIGDDSGNVLIELTQLCTLTLEYLPKLTSFISQFKVPSTPNAASDEIVSVDHEPETRANFQ
ncbi:hypothetical protein GH714_003263 [Hevea brasiliensis]|uniref:NB-ARC domain-containing protein n=1 Tax=Hevea brasiliensis TaxID=3981 RepID=A0A6A6KHN6_HEVBR|nr:hypothetical protein GH714_003263 [Hevea brasiliensis]